MITLLTRRTLQWVESLWNANSPVTQTRAAFTNHFKKVFGQAVSELSVQDRLSRLRRGGSTVWENSIQFRNKTAPLTAFRQGLNPRIRRQMAIYDDTVGLETFILKAIRISQHLTACEKDLQLSPPPSIASSAPAPEPMHINSHHLTERDRRIYSGLCLYCGVSGHLLHTCPVCPPRPAVSTIHLNPQISTILCMTIHFSSRFHFSTSPHRLWILGEVHLSRHVELSAIEKKTSLPDPKPRHHSRKTTGLGQGQVPLPQHYAPCRVPIQGGPLIPGAIHHGCSPGTPVAHPTFSSLGLEEQQGPTVE